MNTITNTVETGEDFRVLLKRLTRHFESLGPNAPEVDDVLLRWAAALPDQAPDPGWTGLAGQLLDALTAPSAGLADPAPMDTEPPVSTSGDLRTLMRALAADYAQARHQQEDRRAHGLWAGDGGSWAHDSLDSLLESWDAWLGASLGSPPRFPGIPPIEPVTWTSVAWQLGAARVYERHHPDLRCHQISGRQPSGEQG
ncbi:hypothetical protein [Kitasatospora sp. NPDC085879]|uniref:hypothetical protein n=1 Tax=Kitasatospora sp. NPDC085879 TaxID=3154769 RepID=UPI003431EC2A